MNKSFKTGVTPCETTSEELTLINKFTVKELTADEVFSFKVVLCDNEIDRDTERFDDEALKTIAELFVGVTGIFDHTPSAKHQSARIYAADFVEDSSKKTSYGATYKCVIARAYMPITDANKDLITEILAGIKKEVSVSCAVRGRTCSVCGADLPGIGCKHKKGEIYSGKKCHCVLSDVTDAYEWSFVAIPAQIKAGVTKSYEKEFYENMEDCIKSIKEGNAVNLSAEQTKQIADYIERLEKQSEDGKVYRRQLIGQTVKYAMMSVPTLKAENVRAMCESMDIDGLIEVKNAFMKKAGELIPLEPQLKSNKENKKSDNNNYKF